MGGVRTATKPSRGIIGGEIVASVEAVFEFGEVAGHMLVPDGTVSASDGAFDVPEGGVDPLERVGQSGLAAGSSDDWLMDAPGVADTGETAQAVTDDRAGGIEIALCQGRDFGTAETLYPAQLQADWPTLRCGFDRRHNRRLAGRTAGTWFRAMYHLTQSKGGISSIELGRRLGVTQTTAWKIKHKLMQVMMERDATKRLTGRIEVDDAYLGGERNGGKRGHSGTLVAAKIVPAIKDVCRRQAVHW
jgi:hypothetical protein